MDVGQHPVHRARCADDPGAKNRSDDLVSQADAENGQASFQSQEQPAGIDGVFRPARAGRQHDARITGGINRIRVDPVMLHNLAGLAQQRQVTDEAEGKGIIVIKDQQQRFIPLSYA